ncbi:MAG TPA: response regulator [Balneolaceae bacterium]|nr:response regulator [Balneolaceae bacterium]
MHPSDKSILIIEDNPDDGLLTMRALKKLKYENIRLVETGSQALDYLYNRDNQEHGGSSDRLPPDLILLDLNLPIIDGFTILKKIRSAGSTKHIPVVVLTSSGEDKDIKESYDLGANSYIRKPVDFIEFEKAAVLISEYWLKLNVTPSE